MKYLILMLQNLKKIYKFIYIYITKNKDSKMQKIL